MGDRLGVDEQQAVGFALEVAGDGIRTTGVVGDGEDDHLHSVTLGLPDGLGEVVVARDEIDDVDDAIAAVGGEVEADPQVDTLLFAAVGDAPEPQLDPRQEADLVLVEVGHAAGASTGVIPVDPQQRQSARRLRLVDQALDQARWSTVTLAPE